MAARGRPNGTIDTGYFPATLIDRGPTQTRQGLLNARSPADPDAIPGAEHSVRRGVEPTTLAIRRSSRSDLVRPLYSSGDAVSGRSPSIIRARQSERPAVRSTGTRVATGLGRRRSAVQDQALTPAGRAAARLPSRQLAPRGVGVAAFLAPTVRARLPQVFRSFALT